MVNDENVVSVVIPAFNAAETLQDTLDSVSNRLSLAILVGSLVIGSSVIVLSGTPPKWHGIPIIGIIGFVVAGLISIALIVSLIRRSRSD